MDCRPADGKVTTAYGPFRLVRYAQFLVRELLPPHDALCEEEGNLMLAHAAGDKSAEQRLKECSGRVEALYSRLWAEE